MKSTDEQEKITCLPEELEKEVEEEILSFIFNLAPGGDLYRIIEEPEGEFEKIVKKITEKTQSYKVRISSIIIPPLIMYISGSEAEEKRKENAKKELRRLIRFFSWSEPRE